MTVEQERLTGEDWLDSWDRQQEGYIPGRIERAQMIFEVITRLRGETPRVLDLACGPGSLTRMLLQRVPNAEVIGVDLDPVLLELARWAVGDGSGRVAWAETDLGEPGWDRQLPGSFDAVMSTTALHWLAPGQLTEAFRSAYRVLRPGGVFVNGDHIDFPSTARTLNRLSEQVSAEWTRSRLVEDYRDWHDALQRARPDWPWQERERRFADRFRSDTDNPAPGIDLHCGALRDAGFDEVEVVWQQWNQRVLVAIKPD